jgi:hypothetical protein
VLTSLVGDVIQSNKKKNKEKDMGYFERAVISNGYFEGAVTSKIPKKVIGFHNIQHDILLVRVTLI